MTWTERQANWLKSLPNETSVENPVLYRHQKLKDKREHQHSPNHAESHDVFGLLSQNAFEHNGSGSIISRIEVSRKERHDVILNDIDEELVIISTELEPVVEEACKSVKSYLLLRKQDLETSLSPLSSDEALEKLSFQELSMLSSRIQKEKKSCELAIENLYADLLKVEKQRSTMISTSFHVFVGKLVSVAHLMPADVHRLMECKVLEVNKSILANQRGYADLRRRLLIVNTECAKKNYMHYRSRLDDWKGLRAAYALSQFRSYMKSDAVVASPLVSEQMSLMKSGQTRLNSSRLELLEQLRMLKPPCSKAQVQLWNNSIVSSMTELDNLHARCLQNFRDVYQQIGMDCSIVMKDILAGLVNDNILPDETLEAKLEEQFESLVGEQKAFVDGQMSSMETYLSDVTAAQKLELQALFQYALGAAHEWDCHEIGIAKAERSLQDLLDRARREHDHQNQIKEAKLDIAIDRMRQDSSEESLSGSLKQVMGMLDDIKNGYLEFNANQKSICDRYPQMVISELERYLQAIKEYFKTFSRVNDVATEENGVRPLSLTGRASLSIPALVPIISSHDYLQTFHLDAAFLDDLKVIIKRNFLDYSPERSQEVKIAGERYKLMKIEESNNELDLRLHLHEPRSTRVKQDVHNVRATELIVHRQRITQHQFGIQEALEKLKCNFKTMVDLQMGESEKFRQTIEELEKSLGDAGKPQQLSHIQNQLTGKVDEFMDATRASVRLFRFNLDEMLNKLRVSNANFQKTLRLFSDGGNFSPDEVEEFRRKLEKSASRIDSVEGSLMSELEGMETKRLASAKESAAKLDEKFKQHMLDLAFIDKISRALSNIQIKIKTEVANSNSQSKHISELLSKLHNYIESFPKKTADSKDFLTPNHVHNSLLPVFEAVHKRIFYLNCAVDENVYVKFEEYKNRAVRRDSPVEKLIVRSPDLRGGSRKSAKLPSEKVPSRSASRISTKRPSSIFRSPPLGEMSEPDTEIESIPAAENLEDQMTSLHHLGNSRSSTQKSLGGKLDKKYYAFGDVDLSMKSKDQFAAAVLHILQHGLEALLSTAEVYYKQKGQRVNTRQKQIYDSFDACAESLTGRLRKYKEQTEEYANSCVQEFGAQLTSLSVCTEKLPASIMKFAFEKHIRLHKEATGQCQAAFDSLMEKYELTRREHQVLLRPTLGHPNSKNELKALTTAEESRQNEVATSIKQHKRLSVEISVKHTKAFILDLRKLVSMLMLLCDSMVTNFDIYVQTPAKKLLSEAELLRKRFAKEAVGDREEAKPRAKENMVWDYPNLLEMFPGIDSDQPEPLISQGSNSSHQAVIAARDETLQEFANYYRKQASSTDALCSKHEKDAQRWRVHWNDSVNKIIGFYTF